MKGNPAEKNPFDSVWGGGIRLNHIHILGERQFCILFESWKGIKRAIRHTYGATVEA